MAAKHNSNISAIAVRLYVHKILTDCLQKTILIQNTHIDERKSTKTTKYQAKHKLYALEALQRYGRDQVGESTHSWVPPSSLHTRNTASF